MLLRHAVVIAAALCLPSAAVAATTQHDLVPPIHETFTLLPCSGSPQHRTTLQIEGCEEHLVVRRDAQIDAAADTLASKLAGGGRRDLVDGARNWLTYRDDDCRALASSDAGGTIAGVVDAQCLAAADTARLTELRGLLAHTSSTR